MMLCHWKTFFLDISTQQKMNTPKISKSDYLVMWHLIPEEENPQLNHGKNLKKHCVVMYYMSILMLLQVLHYIFYNSFLFQTATH